jgi:hypothetical protein
MERWWFALAMTAVTGLGILGRAPAEGHSCLQVDVLVPVTTTLVGTCAPHEPLTHDCGVTPVGVLLLTQCTDVPVGPGVTRPVRR